MIQSIRQLKLIMDASGTCTPFPNYQVPLVYTGSYGFLGIQCFVPKTNSAVGTPQMAVYHAFMDDLGQRSVDRANLFNLVYTGSQKIGDLEYMVFECPFPEAFTRNAGELTLYFNYIEVDDTVVPKRVLYALATNKYTLIVKDGGLIVGDPIDIDISQGEVAQINQNTIDIETLKGLLNDLLEDELRVRSLVGIGFKIYKVAPDETPPTETPVPYNGDPNAIGYVWLGKIAYVTPTQYQMWVWVSDELGNESWMALGAFPRGGGTGGGTGATIVLETSEIDRTQLLYKATFSLFGVDITQDPAPTYTITAMSGKAKDIVGGWSNAGNNNWFAEVEIALDLTTASLMRMEAMVDGELVASKLFPINTTDGAVYNISGVNLNLNDINLDGTYVFDVDDTTTNLPLLNTNPVGRDYIMASGHKAILVCRVENNEVYQTITLTKGTTNYTCSRELGSSWIGAGSYHFSVKDEVSGDIKYILQGYTNIGTGSTPDDSNAVYPGSLNLNTSQFFVDPDASWGIRYNTAKVFSTADINGAEAGLSARNVTAGNAIINDISIGLGGNSASIQYDYGEKDPSTGDYPVDQRFALKVYKDKATLYTYDSNSGDSTEKQIATLDDIPDTQATSMVISNSFDWGGTTAVGCFGTVDTFGIDSKTPSKIDLIFDVILETNFVTTQWRMMYRWTNTPQETWESKGMLITDIPSDYILLASGDVDITQNSTEVKNNFTINKAVGNYLEILFWANSSDTAHADISVYTRPEEPILPPTPTPSPFLTWTNNVDTTANSRVVTFTLNNYSGSDTPLLNFTDNIEGNVLYQKPFTQADPRQPWTCVIDKSSAPINITYYYSGSLVSVIVGQSSITPTIPFPINFVSCENVTDLGGNANILLNQYTKQGNYVFTFFPNYSTGSQAPQGLDRLIDGLTTPFVLKISTSYGTGLIAEVVWGGGIAINANLIGPWTKLALDTTKLPYTLLGSSIDLNTILTSGSWSLLGANTNAPVTNGGQLQCTMSSGGSYGLQEFTTNATPQRKFTRSYSSSTWGSWSEIAYKSDIPMPYVPSNIMPTNQVVTQNITTGSGNRAFCVGLDIAYLKGGEYSTISLDVCLPHKMNTTSSSSSTAEVWIIISPISDAFDPTQWNYQGSSDSFDSNTVDDAINALPSNYYFNKFETTFSRSYTYCFDTTSFTLDISGLTTNCAYKISLINYVAGMGYYSLSNSVYAINIEKASTTRIAQLKQAQQDAKDKGKTVPKGIAEKR